MKHQNATDCINQLKKFQGNVSAPPSISVADTTEIYVEVTIFYSEFP